ncbi:39S ribosomal protein L21, mitochondrial [Microplitis demolitor]|uniref:39S ribosomal protein L21, mitochondrial n=1 Tax=Microplitis demolitor TaxID=69319 RepID=UPI00235B6DA3|nr:39S ribosomal protein L21, mitochondrial [Microplitis demolitor]
MALFIKLPRVFNFVNNLNKQINTSNLRQFNTSKLSSARCTSKVPPLVKESKYKTALPWIYKDTSTPMQVPEPSEYEERMEKNVIEEINNQVLTDNTSRLFAVVALAGKQFKVTENDLIVVQGYWPPNPGDKLKLEKILLVGGTDFTLVGRPILNRELVGVDATVIDKTFSHTKYEFRYRPRKQYKRLNFTRTQLTTVRINSINIKGAVDEKKEVEGLDRIY